VVVVDNSATNRKILSRLAATLGSGMVVDACADPVQAMTACREHPPDLIVIAGEPARNAGARFVKRLRDDPACGDVPALVIVSPEERHCVDRALETGAADCLISPIDHTEFRARARNLLLRNARSNRVETTNPAPAPRQLEPHEPPGLSRAHERLLRVIDAVPAMICATDAAGRYIFCNHHFASFLGVRPGRLIGKRPLEIDDGPLARKLTELDARLVAGQAQPGSFEEELVGRSGEPHDFLTTKALLPAGDGDEAMVVTVSLDITARKRAERDLVAVKEQAEIANRSKTEFLANMSHELRTPLNAIIGFSQVMAGEMLGPIATQRYVGYANDILTSAEHLLGIINDILDVSKLETGKLDLDETMIDLPKAIADLLALVEGKALAEQVRITQRREGEVPRLRGDLRKVKQIVLNLLTNAIKFSGSGDEVGIVLGCDAGSISIAVIDHGIGMDEREVQLAMTRFGQVTGPWVRQHAGTGLGLPLAIGLAELHGGKVQVQSRKEAGTTVTVTFPAERSEGMFGAASAASVAAG
jgi:PAS domain S-box-containing protein